MHTIENVRIMLPLIVSAFSVGGHSVHVGQGCPIILGKYPKKGPKFELNGVGVAFSKTNK